MTAGPEGVVGILCIALRPFLHAEVREGVAEVRQTLLIIDKLIERLEVGQQAQRHACRLDGQTRAHGIRMDNALYEVRHRILLVQLAGALQLVQRFRHTSHLVIGDSRVDMHPCIAWLHQAGTQKGIQGCFGVAALQFEQAQAGQGNIVIGVLFQRLIEGCA